MSAGTSASYIRKLSGLLKKQGIMDSRKGVRGIHVPEIKDPAKSMPSASKADF